MRVRRSHSSEVFDRDGTFRYMKEAVRVRNIEVYTVVSCPRGNLHDYQTGRRGITEVCQQSEQQAESSQTHRLFITQLTGLYNKKDSGNKVRSHMKPTENCIIYTVSRGVSPTILRQTWAKNVHRRSACITCTPSNARTFPVIKVC